ncbi:MAG: hypothetical protein ACU0CO_01770 [Shimia sp.]
MSHADFQKRVGRADRRNRRLVKGGVTVTRPDGLMVMRPRRRLMPRWFRPLLTMALGLFVFKTMLVGLMGAGAYGGKIAQLEQGTEMERLAARLMVPDPYTTEAARLAQPVFVAIRTGSQEFNADGIVNNPFDR